MRCQRRSCEAVCECVVYPYFCYGSATSCEASTWRVSVAGDSDVRSLSRRVVCGRYVGVHGLTLACADTEIQSRQEVRGMRMVHGGRGSVD